MLLKEILGPPTYDGATANRMQRHSGPKGEKPIKFIPNILDPHGEPIPIYADGTFPVVQMPGISGTPSGSICPPGPDWTPPTVEETAARLGVTPERVRAGLAAIAKYEADRDARQPSEPIRSSWRPAPTKAEIAELAQRYPQAAPSVVFTAQQPRESALATPPPSPKPPPAAPVKKTPKPQPTLF